MTRSSDVRFSKLSHPYLAFLATEKYIQVRVLSPGDGDNAISNAASAPLSSWGSIFEVLPRYHYDKPTAPGAVSKVCTGTTYLLLLLLLVVVVVGSDGSSSNGSSSESGSSSSSSSSSSSTIVVCSTVVCSNR